MNGLTRSPYEEGCKAASESPDLDDAPYPIGSPGFFEFVGGFCSVSDADMDLEDCDSEPDDFGEEDDHGEDTDPREDDDPHSCDCCFLVHEYDECDQRAGQKCYSEIGLRGGPKLYHRSRHLFNHLPETMPRDVRRLIR